MQAFYEVLARRITSSRKGRNSNNVNPSGLTSDTKEQWIQDMKNETFERYYLAQKLVDEDEWHQFLEFLRKPLPTTFRLSGSRELSHDLNKIIQETYIPHLSNVTFEGVRLDPPVQIPWYPQGLAWRLDVPKSAIRRSPEFKRFHNFLVYETDAGNISRQEAVSMIPPLLLDVESNHLVLDMCAAPGSKTAQLLEALHKASSHQETIPSGIVIANDSDFKRTHLLVHQSSRLPSPAFMVTNLDASSYPKIFVDSQSLKFDRILCDVPCSGDGTLRKNLNIWRHWQSMDGNGLHALQMRILTRAMKLLKPNGRIVYSTCSLNPVENEAVVAGALQNHPEFEIVDVSSDLPDLARKPGLVTWYPVVNKELVHLPSYDDYLTYWRNLDGPKSALKMVPTHWPPSNAEDLNLHRWIYPHLQDMGGFFIAVLRRKATSLTEEDLRSIELLKRKRTTSHELDSRGHESKRSKVDVDGNSAVENELECVNDSTGNDSGNSGRFKEAPYSFLDTSHPQLKQLMNDLQLSPSFPVSNLFVRNPEGAGSKISLRSIYLCNDVVKRIIEANDYSRMRLVSAGTKLFTRQDGGENVKNLDANASATRHQFRILADGVTTLLPYIPRDTVCSGNKDDLKQLLKSYHPLIKDLSEPFQIQIVAKDNGNLLNEFPPFDEDNAVQHPLVLPLWKSNASVSLMMDKKSKSALSLRVFGEDITIFGKEAHQKYITTQKRREEAIANATAEGEASRMDLARGSVNDNGGEHNTV